MGRFRRQRLRHRQTLTRSRLAFRVSSPSRSRALQLSLSGTRSTQRRSSKGRSHHSWPVPIGRTPQGSSQSSLARRSCSYCSPRGSRSCSCLLPITPKTQRGQRRHQVRSSRRHKGRTRRSVPCPCQHPRRRSPPRILATVVPTTARRRRTARLNRLPPLPALHGVDDDPDPEAYDHDVSDHLTGDQRPSRRSHGRNVTEPRRLRTR